jgi:hypothetical protein
MCTFVETPDARVLIDAGVALGPRFRKFPHPLEYKARSECRARIREYAAKADVVVVSHYHNDHHTPNYTETVWIGCSLEEAEAVYSNKTVLVKDARNFINFSQRRRGWMFQRFAKRVGEKCEVADDKTFEFGSTKIRFSQPVPHGEVESGLGWLLMTFVESEGDKFLHASDVQGPMSKQTTRLILKEKPDAIVLGGPPLYLQDYKVDKETIQMGIQNAAKITRKVPLTILEHHLLRSENWKEEARAVYDSAQEAEHKVLTAAEYLDIAPALLESKRESLYESQPPSDDFMKWTKLREPKRRLQAPPI